MPTGMLLIPAKFEDDGIKPEGDKAFKVIFFSLYKRQNFWKWRKSPKRQYSPNREADHKPNAEPPKDDFNVIWKEFVKNSSMWSIFHKKLTN